jgi:hypothetical protein
VQPATEHCRCGRPYALISGIQGRQEEATSFLTPGGGLHSVQPIVFHHVMDNIHAGAWQITQIPATWKSCSPNHTRSTHKPYGEHAIGAGRTGRATTPPVRPNR